MGNFLLMVEAVGINKFMERESINHFRYSINLRLRNTRQFVYNIYIYIYIYIYIDRYIYRYRYIYSFFLFTSMHSSL
jgi:hypothetical protein